MKKISFALFLLFVMYLPGFSQIVLWDGGAGTSKWSDANNWSGNTLPVAGDLVVLNHNIISGDYTVVLPNTLVNIQSLSIYPSTPGDSIFVSVPSTNNIAPNLRLSGTGFDALRIGNRGKFENRANTFGNVIVFDDLPNHGLLLDTGGYFYQGSKSNDTCLLRKLTALTNSTFEFDRPIGGYQNLVFPVNSQVGNVTFYNVIFSGRSSGSMAYGGTLANNWNLIINGDLTVKDDASFGVVVGAAGQNRYVRIRGNINIVNTTNTLWFESAASVSFGWFTIFEGSSVQSINGNITFLDSVIINNPNGLVVNNNFDVKTCTVFPITSSHPLLKLKSGLLTTTGSGIIRVLLTSVNSIIGQSNNSYVNGKLRRNVTGTGTYDLPVGTSSHYQIATISLSGITGVSSITTQFITTSLGSIPTPLTESSNSYNYLVDAGYWRITPNAVMSGGSYSLTLNERGYSTGVAPYYTIVKRIDEFNPWVLQGTYVGYSETGGTITAQLSSFTSFPDFAIANPLAVLPIELIEFKAIQQNHEVLLNWVTASEINNNYFTIEKSRNGENWESVQQISGAGNSVSTTYYSALDTSPFNGISYYRLKQTDFNGQYSYSEMVAVYFEPEEYELSIYPNPTSRKLFIKGKSQTVENVGIYNSIGQLLFTKSISEDFVTELDFESFAEGVYLIKTQTNTYKIIKIN
jgi:hypothetical protein